ncbi:BQ2448_5435 [Microbotryum intermedium]|uniref:BQ2448_5435 protein n=1 Tax=Microbotryum intermedium TaxID=269621 RepID=A0A238F7H8_9BASI|nr:BQ2448_5435 [Microbotryum intermedium]
MHGGHATWYTPTGPVGACLLPPPSNRHFAAMNDDGWGRSWLCGMCVEITAHNGNKVNVMITDRSLGQAGGCLDLSREAFSELGDTELGQIDMSWKPVNCVLARLASGKPQVVWKPGSSKDWFAFQIRDSALPIAAVSIRVSAPPGQVAGWLPLPRTNYNFWVAVNGIHTNHGPFDIMVWYQDGSHHPFWRVVLNSVMSP